MQAERVREGIAAARATGDEAHEASLRLDADAHFPLVAVRSGMRFAERVQAVMNDQRLCEAMEAFAWEFPDTTDLRDMLTRIDQYVLHQGHLPPAARSKRKGRDPGRVLLGPRLYQRRRRLGRLPPLRHQAPDGRRCRPGACSTSPPRRGSAASSKASTGSRRPRKSTKTGPAGPLRVR
jgi:hypothetical protein